MHAYCFRVLICGRDGEVCDIDNDVRVWEEIGFSSKLRYLVNHIVNLAVRLLQPLTHLVHLRGHLVQQLVLPSKLAANLFRQVLHTYNGVSELL